MSAVNEIKVWDPLVRVFHWALVAGFFLAYFTEDELLPIHVAAGYTVLGLVGFRLLWGVVGTRHARFSDFAYPPAKVRAYVRDVLRARAGRYLGHNPAGGAMILVLLAMLVLVTATGLAAYGAHGHAGPLAGLLAGSPKWLGEGLEDVHEVLANVTVALVAIHVAGVVAESLLHRENLVRAMITGRKRG